MSKAPMRLTQEQFNSLCHEGRLLHNYWRQWNQNLYNQAWEDGSLYEMVNAKGEQLQEEMDDLVNRGLTEAEAREIVWEEIYQNREPERAENDPVMEFLHQYKQNAQEMTQEKLDDWVEKY